ncbi:MAG: tRNA lysidine(34) synthetase TilS [Piscinibacter sp.]|nr:tRNA lysidine(34) synthetase TilS [Piscinibacter sp.]
MAPRCVAVAWSGGRDSTALLHATLQAARPLSLSVLALHVHHGLHPNADDWVEFCVAQTRRWARRGHDLALHVERLTGRPGPGESVEAWARLARYGALRRMALAHGAEVVLLAHHRRDQAETLLLQALRGAGVAGLAGMPASIERDGLQWARPWLARSDAEVAAYVRRHRLRHIEDDSNADERFARNRLRHQVWPGLLEAFPGAESALADSAGWARDAMACLAELAQQDLEPANEANALRLAPLFELSLVRRLNALRHWLHARTGVPAPASLVQRLADELRPVGNARWPAPGGELRSHRGRLVFTPAAAAPEPGPTEPETSLRVDSPGRYPLPGWGGTLQVRRVRQGGVPLAWLAQLELRRREGGERFQAGPGRPPRSLKKQFQAAGLPSWQRDGPLVYSGGQLVFVPGLGLDARVVGLPGQALATLAWLPAR